MIAVGAFFIWLAIKKDFEPLLLVPIGLGIILGNIPFRADAGLEIGLYEDNSVLNLPFLVGCAAGLAVLEHGDIVFPFCLSRQGGKFRHGTVPVEVKGRFHDHKEPVAEDVYFHFQDAHGTDALTDFRP